MRCGNDDNSACSSACKRHRKNTPLLSRIQSNDLVSHDLESLCVYNNCYVVAFVWPCATTALLGAQHTVSADLVAVEIHSTAPGVTSCKHVTSAACNADSSRKAQSLCILASRINVPRQDTDSGLARHKRLKQPPALPPGRLLKRPPHSPLQIDDSSSDGGVVAVRLAERRWGLRRVDHAGWSCRVGARETIA